MRVQSGLPGMDSRTEPQRKPEGGFAFFSVIQLVMAWTAFRERHIGLKELRAYFALAEMKSRRCGLRDDGTEPKFTPLELAILIGGAGEERAIVQKLLAVGLLRSVSKTSIEFATDPSELHFVPKTLDDTLALLGNPDRRIPVPRRIIRLIAAGARRTLIATILGHLIRCMFYKKGLCHPSGCVKASWIAKVFGVSTCGVKAQRQHLIKEGWLIPLKTCQWTLNQHGLRTAINLAWNTPASVLDKDSSAPPPTTETAAKDETTAAEPVAAPASTTPHAAPEPPPPPAAEGPAELTPLPAQPGAQTEPPCINKKPLPRGSKNQKPAPGGTSGVSIPNSESKKTDTPATQSPTLRNVTPEDLRDPARLLDLHAQAVAAGYITSSEADRLNFFAAANHTRVIGSRNPPGLFVRIVRSGLWAFLTQADDDAARLLLRRALYPEDKAAEPFHRGQLLNGMTTAKPSFATTELSADACFVRDITNLLRRRGIPESSMWRLVNRERPEWTRERWDEAQAELQGTSSSFAEAAVAGY